MSHSTVRSFAASAFALAFVTITSAGCATTGDGSSGGTMAALESAALGEAEQVGATELSSRLHVNPTYVTTAVGVAKGLLSKGSTPANAAQQGVSQASAQAAANGQPLNANQQSGLVSGIAGLFGSSSPAPAPAPASASSAPAPAAPAAAVHHAPPN